MFCFQCQEANGNKGCTKIGVCGKSAELAALQDLLIWNLKGLSDITTRLREDQGLETTRELDQFITESIFTTITNANFNRKEMERRIEKTLDYKKEYLGKLDNEEGISDAGLWFGDNYLEKAREVGVLLTEDEDVRSLRELISYGIKGLAAYMKHSNVLGYEDKEIDIFLQGALARILFEEDLDSLVGLTLETGENGAKAMALLDSANTGSYGNPEISKVDIGVGENPGILISGHDLKDLEMLLEQTEGTGVDIYSHSEMLPAHYYPAFKKYEHFKGNYGNAWWKQREEFESFRGPILMTTNCIVPVKDSYRDRIFTTGAAGYEGLVHIEKDGKGHKDFSEIIDLAKKCESPIEIEKGEIVGGFAHNQVIELADEIVAAVKDGSIKKFVVMAGCDGRMKSRDYYREFAEKLPKDTVILTAGCAKYRYNKLNLGDINGIPRVLDAGQCNDSYSLVVIALKLKEIFELEDINELPIIYNIAWYEQKAVIVLLALLSLGVKNIHLGPSLPAFISENVLNILVENFNISGITDVDQDMEYFFG